MCTSRTATASSETLRCSASITKRGQRVVLKRRTSTTPERDGERQQDQRHGAGGARQVPVGARADGASEGHARLSRARPVPRTPPPGPPGEPSARITRHRQRADAAGPIDQARGEAQPSQPLGAAPARTMRGGAGDVGVDAVGGGDAYRAPRVGDGAPGGRVDDVVHRDAAGGASGAQTCSTWRGRRLRRSRPVCPGAVQVAAVVVGDEHPPAPAGACAAGGDVAAEAHEHARAGVRGDGARGAVGGPRLGGGTQIQARCPRERAPRDARGRARSSPALRTRHAGSEAARREHRSPAGLADDSRTSPRTSSTHGRHPPAAASRGRSRRAPAPHRAWGRRRLRSAVRRAAPHSDASISSASDTHGPPARLAFTRDRSESARKRLHARSIAASSAPTSSRASASASGSVTRRTTLVPSASQLAARSAH